MSDDEYKNTAVIVAPVHWPSDMPKPDKKNLHVTYMFLGDVDENELVKADVEDAIRSTLLSQTYIFAKVYELDHFGPDSDIPVVKVKNPHLQRTYKALAEELRKRDIVWSQNYEFNPHVTIDETLALMGPFPDNVMLLPVELWWKNTKIRFGKEEGV